ncbi:hypothetical protein QWZ13_04220 [Reinekea marina]|uniref:hypothetical protein n=1 Tax=Reinekea marina TaxID=1310421 RepID=UPI0025B4CFD5|nr:hypothetical protein [Reinekea marina]MDN3648109.1 hypothetical protein [Reinekea marina]
MTSSTLIVYNSFFSRTWNNDRNGKSALAGPNYGPTSSRQSRWNLAWHEYRRQPKANC